MNCRRDASSLYGCITDSQQYPLLDLEKVRYLLFSQLKNNIDVVLFNCGFHCICLNKIYCKNKQVVRYFVYFKCLRF